MERYNIGSCDVKIETAKRLLDMGFALSDIIKATTLSESEIKNIPTQIAVARMK